MNPAFIRPQKKQEQGNPLYDMPLLFDAALTEFAEKSFDSASLNDIIKRSGLSKGSFYHKFNDKLDLYLCLMDMISQKKAAFTSKTPPAEDFFEVLHFILNHSLAFAFQEPRYTDFWRRFLMESHDVKEAVQNAFPSSGDALEAMVEAASEKGQLNFPAPFVSGVVTLLIGQLHTLIRADMSYEDIRSLESNLVDMLKRGLSKPNPNEIIMMGHPSPNRMI